MFHFGEGRQKGTLEEEREFYTFISYEAVEAIEDYLKAERNPTHRNPYIFSSSQIHSDYMLQPWNVQRDLRKLNKRLKINSVPGKYNPITSHMFRKFFSTQLANTEMSYEARKTLMGHVIPGVDDNYYLKDPEALQKIYLKYLPELLIYDTEVVVIDTTQELLKKHQEELQKRDERDKAKDGEYRETIDNLSGVSWVLELLDEDPEFQKQAKEALKRRKLS